MRYNSMNVEYKIIGNTIPFSKSIEQMMDGLK